MAKIRRMPRIKERTKEAEFRRVVIGEVSRVSEIDEEIFKES